jgi:hypothetical protein
MNNKVAYVKMSSTVPQDESHIIVTFPVDVEWYKQYKNVLFITERDNEICLPGLQLIFQDNDKIYVYNHKFQSFMFKVKYNKIMNYRIKFGNDKLTCLGTSIVKFSGILQLNCLKPKYITGELIGWEQNSFEHSLGHFSNPFLYKQINKIEPILPIKEVKLSYADMFLIINKKLRCEKISHEVDELQESLKANNLEIENSNKEMENLKPLIKLPEVNCPACLQDFLDIPDKVVILSCSHMICIDCVKKIVSQSCPLCKALFVLSGVRVAAWLRDQILADPFVIKEKNRKLVKEKGDDILKKIS